MTCKDNCSCEKVDLAKLPTAAECKSCGLVYCDCDVCESGNTVQVEPVEISSVE